jgi:hypothetical protein
MRHPDCSGAIMPGAGGKVEEFGNWAGTAKGMMNRE